MGYLHVCYKEVSIRRKNCAYSKHVSMRKYVKLCILDTPNALKYLSLMVNASFNIKSIKNIFVMTDSNVEMNQ